MVVGQIHSLTRQEHESVEDLVSLVFVDGIFDIEERFEGVRGMRQKVCRSAVREGESNEVECL